MSPKMRLLMSGDARYSQASFAVLAAGSAVHVRTPSRPSGRPSGRVALVATLENAARTSRFPDVSRGVLGRGSRHDACSRYRAGLVVRGLHGTTLLHRGRE